MSERTFSWRGCAVATFRTAPSVSDCCRDDAHSVYTRCLDRAGVARLVVPTCEESTLVMRYVLLGSQFLYLRRFRHSDLPDVSGVETVSQGGIDTPSANFRVRHGIKTLLLFIKFLKQNMMRWRKNNTIPRAAFTPVKPPMIEWVKKKIILSPRAIYSR
ncbi:hypothetical protein AVEN_54421-1 [Araneus ventricosus]|uniref:Uncharacterized protein n=1 Tax=Araneus ventricosus TaxID=182803 RepID=A0A4Y2DCY1_ARAVE|nr:hypothetical protein AVEN_54421-1 [Araneus ventricosus]